jgi:hypothetical protein
VLRRNITTDDKNERSRRLVLNTLCRSLSIAAAVAVVSAPIQRADACACCADEAYRYVENERFTGERRTIVSQLRFDSSAVLTFNDSDLSPAQQQLSERPYHLKVERSAQAMRFSLMGSAGLAGTFILQMPDQISVFEVDPREGGRRSEDPTLYKEWKLTAPAAADGVFSRLVQRGQRMTLIFHGSGNLCESPAQFRSWTLVIHGGGRVFQLFGELKK